MYLAEIRGFVHACRCVFAHSIAGALSDLSAVVMALTCLVDDEHAGEDKKPAAGRDMFFFATGESVEMLVSRWYQRSISTVTSSGV
jgi:hypothetical protein